MTYKCTHAKSHQGLKRRRYLWKRLVWSSPELQLASEGCMCDHEGCAGADGKLESLESEGKLIICFLEGTDSGEAQGNVFVLQA